MARVDANINKETLEFICSQIGVSVSFLSQRTGHTEERVSAWLDITSNEYPTINQAKAIAKVLKVPFAGLYMSKEKLPVKQLPPLRNLRRLPDGLIYDDSITSIPQWEKSWQTRKEKPYWNRQWVKWKEWTARVQRNRCRMIPE